ncbi:phage tail protein, partial [Mycobacterium tuberculosis]|nr:phage tail protein [Mycobacterium tuberculosis]
ELQRAEASSLPTSVAVTASDALADFRRITVTARLGDGSAGREASADLPLVLPVETTAALAEIWLRDARAGRETVRFGLGPGHLALEPGDIVTLP